MIESIDFWPRLQAQDYHFTDNDLVISITDPKQDLPNIRHPAKILRLAFYDIEDNITEPRFANFRFNETHATDIINYLELHHKEDKKYNLIVHCEAGVSRSAAVALFAHNYTKAHFSNLSKTSHANSYIVGVLSNKSGIDVYIPDPVMSKGGILLF